MLYVLIYSSYFENHKLQNCKYKVITPPSLNKVIVNVLYVTGVEINVLRLNFLIVGVEQPCSWVFLIFKNIYIIYSYII